MIDLKKGEKIDLTKGRPSLSKVCIGLGWQVRQKQSKADYDFDLDASAFLLRANGKVAGGDDFIFYGTQPDPNAFIRHSGDDRTGGNSDDGDDEQIELDLSRIPPEIDKIAFTVTIYQARTRNQNFGQVSKAYVRLIDMTTDEVLLTFNLTEEYSIETALVVCEIYRYNGEWKFAAVGSGYQGGLGALCKQYGLDVKAEE